MPKYKLSTWYVECGPVEEVEADTPEEAITKIASGPDRWMVDCDELYRAELHTDDEADVLVAELGRDSDWKFYPLIEELE